jgi:multisubunit Na+/H+ antiporter MnhC subunit
MRTPINPARVITASVIGWAIVVLTVFFCT